MAIEKIVFILRSPEEVPCDAIGATQGIPGGEGGSQDAQAEGG